MFKWKNSERFYDNYRDVDIPKIKLTIVENLHIDIKYPSKRLASFLASSQESNEHPEKLSIIVSSLLFEMTFRINKTYLLQVKAPRIDLEHDGKSCVTIENFNDQIDFAMKREETPFKIKQKPLELK